MEPASVAALHHAVAQGGPVLVLAHGNSRVGMGNNGNWAGLNANPNSGSGWYHDVPGYYARYTAEDRTLCGVGAAQTEAWNTTVGYNLPAGTADTNGVIHTRAGYVWEFLKELHRMYPNAVIYYENWSIGGTNSSATIDGEGSYVNWSTMIKGAQNLGAVSHMMGNARLDRRFQNRDDLTDTLCREQVRCAWDTGSADTDAWRIVSPAGLKGIGLSEPEMMDATLQNHEGFPLQSRGQPPLNTSQSAQQRKFRAKGMHHKGEIRGSKRRP